MAAEPKGRVDLYGVSASIPKGADLRHAELRVVDGHRTIIGGPLKIFEDMDDLIFTYQRERAIAHINPETTELHLFDIPRGTRIKLLGASGTTIKPGMIRILPRKDHRWVA